MLKSALNFIQSLDIYRYFLLFDTINSNYLKRTKINFSFYQKKVFKHACATPLTILMSSLEDEFGNRHSLNTSLIALKKLTRIIKTATGEISLNEKINVYLAVRETLSIMRGKFGKDFVFCKNLIKKDLFLVGNKLYFQEALFCLLNNAVEAYNDVSDKPVNLILRTSRGVLRVDVVDYASGMSIFLQKLVLLNGVSTKKNGLGLGLCFAKRTIEEIFAGKMKIKSALGFGTHIVLTIPLKKPCIQNL